VYTYLVEIYPPSAFDLDYNARNTTPTL